MMVTIEKTTPPSAESILSQLGSTSVLVRQCLQIINDNNAKSVGGHIPMLILKNEVSAMKEALMRVSDRAKALDIAYVAFFSTGFFCQKSPTEPFRANALDWLFFLKEKRPQEFTALLVKLIKGGLIRELFLKEPFFRLHYQKLKFQLLIEELIVNYTQEYMAILELASHVSHRQLVVNKMLEVANLMVARLQH